jgi:hypothetical protein
MLGRLLLGLARWTARANLPPPGQRNAELLRTSKELVADARTLVKRGKALRASTKRKVDPV